MAEDESVTQNNSRDLFLQLFEIVVSKGKKELKNIATDSRRRLDLRSLQRDRIRMYEKLGREVECLIAAGEIEHPGLIRGVDRIRQLERQLENLKKISKTSPSEQEEG